MNWSELLKAEVEATYHATEGLMDLVDEESFDWRPQTGENWLPVSKLLMHITWACGCCMKGFVTGDWSTPEDAYHPPPEESEGMLSAERMPACDSLEQARRMLAEDKQRVTSQGEVDADGNYLRTTVVASSAQNSNCVAITAMVWYETSPGEVCDAPVEVSTLRGR